MSTYSEVSRAAHSMRRIYAILGFSILVFSSYTTAKVYPEIAILVGKVASLLVTGFTPLGIAILTIAINALLGGLYVRLACDVLQVVYSGRVGSDSEIVAAEKAAPFFLSLKWKSTSIWPRSYYFQWTLEHSVAWSLFMHLAFLAMLGNFPSFR